MWVVVFFFYFMTILLLKKQVSSSHCRVCLWFSVCCFKKTWTSSQEHAVFVQDQRKEGREGRREKQRKEGSCVVRHLAICCVMLCRANLYCFLVSYLPALVSRILVANTRTMFTNKRKLSWNRGTQGLTWFSVILIFTFGSRTDLFCQSQTDGIKKHSETRQREENNISLFFSIWIIEWSHYFDSFHSSFSTKPDLILRHQQSCAALFLHHQCLSHRDLFYFTICFYCDLSRLICY